MKQLVKLLVDLLTDEELSEDDIECVSDNDDIADSSISVPANAGTFSSPDKVGDSESDSVYLLADRSDGEGE